MSSNFASFSTPEWAFLIFTFGFCPDFSIIWSTFSLFSPLLSHYSYSVVLFLRFLLSLLWNCCSSPSRRSSVLSRIPLSIYLLKFYADAWIFWFTSSPISRFLSSSYLFLAVSDSYLSLKILFSFCSYSTRSQSFYIFLFCYSYCSAKPALAFSSYRLIFLWCSTSTSSY